MESNFVHCSSLRVTLALSFWAFTTLTADYVVVWLLLLRCPLLAVGVLAPLGAQ